MFNWVLLMQILLCLFSADTWFVSSLTDNYIPRKWNNTFFSGNVSTGTDLAINFDLVKCITKINIPQILWKCAGWTLTKNVKYISKMYFRGVFKGHWSFLMSCNLKFTQYMHEPTSQLYGIWLSVPKFLYR